MDSHRAIGFPPVWVPFQVWPASVSLPSLTTTLTAGAPSSPMINDTGGHLRVSWLWNGKTAPQDTMAQRRKQLSSQQKGRALAWPSRLAEGAGVTGTGRCKCRHSWGAAGVPGSGRHGTGLSPTPGRQLEGGLDYRESRHTETLPLRPAQAGDI